MRKLPMDERERIHEAISERNALWAIIGVLIAGVLWQAIQSATSGIFQVNPVIIAAIITGVAAKAATNIYLDQKD